MGREGGRSSLHAVFGEGPSNIKGCGVGKGRKMPISAPSCASRVSVPAWNSLWGGLDINEIPVIDSQIQDMSIPYAKARELAQKWKQDFSSQCGGELVINPKIDSKTQRRIQCSLPFSTFWRIAGRSPSPTDSPSHFGAGFENPVISGSRIFNRD
jgi:hypothetical protein